jgi:hydrogenase nickel incorporation protein HypA/HybF
VHEFSVCRALLDQVVRIAARHDAVRVTSIRVRIGPLSGVDPALLRTAYPLAAEGTCAAQAALSITATDVQVRCKQCGAKTPAELNHLCCGACGALDTELASGDELILESVELAQSSATQDAKDDAHV